MGGGTSRGRKRAPVPEAGAAGTEKPAGPARGLEV